MAPAHLPAVESFYHLTGGLPPDGVCQGLACFVARHLDDGRHRQAGVQDPRVYCLGQCFAAPAAVADDVEPSVEVDVPEAVVLANVATGGAPAIAEYLARGGYAALRKALGMAPEAVLRSVEASQLRGRGGAGFPTGRKWRAVAASQADEKFVVANADEGDPGAFIDRFILEKDPHRLIEAMAIAAHAVGATRGVIYLRSEYPKAAPILRQALEEARQAGFLAAGHDATAPRLGRAGKRPKSSATAGFAIDLVVGRGSYVCGEETALINAIEARRPLAEPRPPHPAQHGLWGQPTLVNNVETLASIPWIVLRGGEAYAALGFSKSRGTKVVSLNSLFNRPGLYEVAFGIPVRRIVEDLGGGLRGADLKGVIIGGPLAGIIPPQLLDTPFGFDELHAIGAAVGHGGVIAFDAQTSIAELVHHVFAFGAYESCGRCTPCRLGSRRLERHFARVVAAQRLAGLAPGLGASAATLGDSGLAGEATGEEAGPAAGAGWVGSGWVGSESTGSGSPGSGSAGPGSTAAAQEWSDLVAVLGATSLCGLGSGLAEFARSVSRYYGPELDRCLA